MNAGGFPTLSNGPLPQAGGTRQRSRLGAALLLLCLLAGMVGILGVLGFRAVRKVQEAMQAFKSGYRGEAKNPSAPPAKPMALIRPCSNVDPTQLSQLRSEEAMASIPLVPDLILVNTWVYGERTDLEELTRITAVGDQDVKTTISGPLVQEGNGKAVITPSRVTEGHPQCQADLFSSHLLVPETNEVLAIPIPGTTRFSVSREVYDALKAARKTSFEYRSHFHPAGDGYSWGDDVKGEIQRDVLAPYQYQVILNGALTELPALHAMGQLDSNPIQIAVLDDPANPLLLDLEIPTFQFALRLTKVTYPVAKKIESELKTEGHAEIYGIYFDFDSATIRPESGPVLDEIAGALKQNPDWHLSIQGHTDSVGGDAHNLDLSRRRAESVKNALAERYAIDAGRLNTEGFGSTKPKAANDTVQGRALNRRVELVRQ